MNYQHTTTTDEDEGLDDAAKKYNKPIKVAWDAAEALKPVEQRQLYVKLSDRDYLDMLVTGLLARLKQQSIDSAKDQISDKYKAATKPERIALRTAINGVAVAAYPTAIT